MRLPRLLLIGAAAVCASVALLPAAALATAAPPTIAEGAATGGLAVAHFGHASGPAKATVTGKEGSGRDVNTSGKINRYNINGGTWSGVAVTGSGFTSVTATWIEPSVTCHSYNDLMGIWVGLDGYGSSTVEQTGVVTDCSSGAPVYQAFYEMYPASPVYYSLTSYPVRAGDQITATVSRSGTTYTLTIHNGTRGWTKNTIKSMSASNTSAEVIVESPTGSFPTFSTVTFTNIQINGLPLADWNPVLMDASNSYGYEDHTSAVSGGSFSISYLHE